MNIYPNEDYRFLVSQIIDFTKLVIDNTKWVCFNPCVTHYRDDLFLCCIRCVTRGYSLDGEDQIGLTEITKNVYGNPNHPWRSMWENNPAEPPINTKNYTKYYMLKIKQIERTNDYSIDVVKEYKELFNDISRLALDQYNAEIRQTVATNEARNVRTDFYTNQPGRQPVDQNNVNGALIRNTQNEAFRIFFENMWDVRIHKTFVEGLFFITGNETSRDPTQPIRRPNQDRLNLIPNPENCDTVNGGRGCTSIYIAAINIDTITLKMTYLTVPRVLCKNYSGSLEKNWSLIMMRHDLLNNLIEFNVTYQIRHKQLGHESMRSSYNTMTRTFQLDCRLPVDTEILNDTIVITNVTRNILSAQYGIDGVKKISLYNMIERAFSLTGIRLNISSTTPTIDFGQDEFISVGHVKYIYNNVLNHPDLPNMVPVPPIHTFTEYCRTNVINFHFEYIYLFFFYTIDRNNGVLRRTSKFYLPQPADVSLIFPMGLTKLNPGNPGPEVPPDNPQDTFLMSYGNYDTTCESMFFTRENLNLSLMDINQISFLQRVNDNPMDDDPVQTNINLRNDILNYDFFEITGWVEDRINKIILK